MLADAMDPVTFLYELRHVLLPSEYRQEIVERVPPTWLVLKKGAYVLAAIPYSQVPQDDFSNRYVKKTLRTVVLAFRLFAEKALFLVYYGSEKSWCTNWQKHQVDKTALRPIIVQSIHFVDPSTGSNQNSRTSWGPIKFGFCGGVIEKIESLCDTIRVGARP